ncbi:hypothetical protein [Candidatus Albibeggiatoa sp. nov. NOAA]|uniref:hypothetical protein n=1 Tax=Candidatus Albibeggiatoa sp. nov. NOAA TaxID=3162724 RepID=UPI0032F4063C|nr:hypothetical protein [Thiotrichaceae bacterium]
MELGIILAIIGIIITLFVGSPAVFQFFGIKDYRHLFSKKIIKSTQKEPFEPFIPTDRYHFGNLPEIKQDQEIVGRDADLQKITDAIKAKKQAIAVVAFGGIGKTTLVRLWLDRWLARNDGEFEKILTWSFYSQGSHDTQNSSARFFEVALRFFEAETIPILEDAKGKALADLIKNQKVMLVLDGLEPLQESVIDDDKYSGMFKDVGIRSFLIALRGTYTTESKSVVLMTSRQKIQELDESKLFEPIDLRSLSDADGERLLASIGVQGSEQELQKASAENEGHALALALLGKLLARYAQRLNTSGEFERFKRHSDEAFENIRPDIGMRHQVALDVEGKDAKEHHVQRILRSYDEKYWDQPTGWQRWWRGEAPERALLYLLGLFDRPMGREEKAILFKKAGIAKSLARLSEDDFYRLVHRLQQAHLLFQTATGWDCHPIIRQYFGQRFKQAQPDAFRQAHLVLFKYYQAIPERHQPDTLPELEPLYRAVVHGCLAGEYKKAMYDVYHERIRRGNEAYSTQKLGAYSQDLTAIAAFFPQGWLQPVQQGLSEDDQAWLLAQTSFYLMSLGRLAEAVEPRKANLKLSEKLEDWKGVSVTARMLVDLYLPLGRLQEAEQAARQAIEYAEKAEELFQQMAGHAYLGTCLHRQGQLEQALQSFKKAEQLEQKNGYKYLLSQRGFRYCTLLLNMRTEVEQVLKRAEYSLKLMQANNWLMDIALDKLTLARCYQALNQPQQAQDYFNQAVAGIREAGKIEFTPMFLIDRANFYLQQNRPAQAKQDLDEAALIIQRGDMKLYKVDWHLSVSKYQLTMNNKAEALKHKNEARKLIEMTGYKLRLKDVV